VVLEQAGKAMPVDWVILEHFTPAVVVAVQVQQVQIMRQHQMVGLVV
jgi:stringent starvation protein B